MTSLIAFVGFGEAAYNIAKGLKTEGLKGAIAYDANQDHEKYGSLIRMRAEETGVTLCNSLREAYCSAKFIASLTSASVAVDVAKSVIPFLNPGQVFIDMNSASPMVKSEIGAISRKDGVFVCDAAVMGTVPKSGHKVKMLLSGDGSQTVYDELSQYGMNLEVLHAELGGASAIKMFKSIVMKGLPQLMFESMYPAMKYGVLDALVKSLNESLYGNSIEQLANTFFARTMVHAKRRSAEMENVITTLEKLNVDSSMSKTVRTKLDNLEESRMKDLVGTNINMSYIEALKLFTCKEKNDE